MAKQAIIKLDPDRTVGNISPLIYGNFVEHLGRCVYGGVYEPDSPLADVEGLRADVIAAARDLNVTITRYPGGNFVSNYHWQDGVGPERIPRQELAWARLETNEFGTHEFMDFVRKIDSEPYFAVNLGTGTIEEAQRWVEYTNIESGPYYAELRRQHGQATPYNIKYWSLGNEMDGHWQMGHLNAEDYAKKAREAAKLMKWTDPSIKLVAAGSSNYTREADPNSWNVTVLNELKDVVDYLAIHIYLGNPDDNYYNFMAAPRVLEERTQIVRGMIDRAMSEADRGDREPIYIAWDEYNVWYRERDGDALKGTHALEERYNLEDALVVAGMLNTFIRQADVVKIANLSQLVNVIGAMFTDESRLFRQTIYFPMQLFARHMKGTALDACVKCDTYDTEPFYIGPSEHERPTQQSNVPYLDVSASLDGDTVVIAVVNRHRDEAIRTDIVLQEGSFAGPLAVYEVNGPDIKTANDFEAEQVATREKPVITAADDQAECTFPPHSFTLLKGQIKR
jgi:alpha-N-arabinofuranosidase